MVESPAPQTGLGLCTRGGLKWRRDILTGCYRESEAWTRRSLFCCSTAMSSNHLLHCGAGFLEPARGTVGPAAAVRDLRSGDPGLGHQLFAVAPVPDDVDA